MKSIFEKLLANRPDLLKKLKRKSQPLPQTEGGVDLAGHHQLESEESGNQWLLNLRNFDNKINNFLRLPEQE